jgi:TrmH family RNA methyltransferase
VQAEDRRRRRRQRANVRRDGAAKGGDDAALNAVAALEHRDDAAAAPRDTPDEPCLASLAAGGTRITGLSRKAFERIAFGSRNEGLVGLVRFSGKTLRQFGAEANRPVIVVDGVEKPGNLGAILRTADAAGLAGVIVCDGRTDPANPAVIRASLGTVFTVPLAAASVGESIDRCRKHARRVIAAMPTGKILWH